MKKQLTECPVCGSGLKVSEYTCTGCATKISGDFICGGSMSGLEKEIEDFIKVFIFAEGSIRQVEKMMNCSYPKVKNLLKKAKAALGLEEDDDSGSDEVLELLAKGDISTEEALEKLNKRRQK